MTRTLFSLIALSIVVCISTIAKGDLIDNGDGTITDTDLQIMWLKDAGSAPSMTFDQAQSWADGLAVAGYKDWRLPRGTDPRTDGTASTPDGQFYYNAVESEFGHLFYNELGGCANWHIDT